MSTLSKIIQIIQDQLEPHYTIESSKYTAGMPIDTIYRIRFGPIQQLQNYTYTITYVYQENYIINYDITDSRTHYSPGKPDWTYWEYANPEFPETSSTTSTNK